MQPLFHIDFIWNFTEGAKRLKDYNQYGRKLFEKVNEKKNRFMTIFIDSHQIWKLIKSIALLQMLEKEVEKDGSGTFMGRLYDVSKENTQFTNEDIFAETATILTGATDTSSAASAFVAVMLAMHPEHQEKVFEEIDAVLPDKNADFTQAALDNLKFTELCIQETLRLFPTAPLIGRVASKPIKLSNNVVVPANIPIVFGLRQIHIQEKYFGPTANIFDPYRFLDEKVKNLPAAAYVPFSYGPRNCIGE